MKLDIQHHYTFAYVPVGKISDRHAVGVCTTTVEIEELAQESAPLVAKVGCVEFSNVRGEETTMANFAFKEDGSPRQVRMRDGHFYVEVCSDAELAQQVRTVSGLAKTVLVTGLEKHFQSPVKELGYQGAKTIWDIRRREQLRPEKTVDDGGAEAGALLKKVATRMFVVDGVVYGRCREPIFVCGATPESAMIIERPVPKNFPWVKYLVKLKSSDGIAITSNLESAEETTSEFGLDSSKIFIEVLRPELLRYDGAANDVYFAAYEAANEIADRIGPPAKRQAYYSLRDALDVIDEACPVVTAQLVDAMNEYISAGNFGPETKAMLALSEIADFTDSRSRHSGSSVRSAGVGLDGGTGFVFGKSAINHYQWNAEHFEQAQALLKLAVARWNGRISRDDLPAVNEAGASVDQESGVVVAQIASRQQLRQICYKVGADAQLYEELAIGGEPFFRVMSNNKREDPYTGVRPDRTTALVSYGNACPVVVGIAGKADEHFAECAVRSVEQHIETMARLEEQRELDEQPIRLPFL